MHFYPELQAQVGAALRNKDAAGTSGGPAAMLTRGVGRFVASYPDLLRWVPTVLDQMREPKMSGVAPRL